MLRTGILPALFVLVFSLGENTAARKMSGRAKCAIAGSAAANRPRFELVPSTSCGTSKSWSHTRPY